jgi:hypothetical protein
MSQVLPLISSKNQKKVNPIFKNDQFLGMEAHKKPTVLEDSLFWTLRKKIPVPCDAGAWMLADRRLAQTVSPSEPKEGLLVSTVFLGVKHGNSETGKPFLFETMVFFRTLVNPVGNEIWVKRTTEWAEAVAAHQEACTQFKLPVPPENTFRDSLAPDFDAHHGPYGPRDRDFGKGWKWDGAVVTVALAYHVSYAEDLPERTAKTGKRCTRVVRVGIFKTQEEAERAAEAIPKSCKAEIRTSHIVIHPDGSTYRMLGSERNFGVQHNFQ